MSNRGRRKREASDDSALRPLDTSVENAAARQRAPLLWIVDCWRDLLFFVGTPVLIIPLVSMARSRFSLEEIALFVVAFGATGHHLPGMMRAYGDRELFSRFKVRFVVAPLFLLTVSMLFVHCEFDGLVLVAVLWGSWHAFMQVHGFLRIYDAKVQSLRRLTAWLDMLMCFAWFGAGLLFSPGRMAQLLEGFYKSGGPLLPAAAIHNFQTAWAVVTAVITVAFLVNLLSRWAAGKPPSPIKLLLMVSSFSFWWYAMVGINNAILGLALFEIFHDVQYLSIVWVFNRKRVEKDPSVGGFTQFLFRRSGVMMGLYVGLVFAYGSMGMLPDSIDQEAVKRFLYGLLVASGLLHFYYDGFIWKVRERSTREGLGLMGGPAEAVISQALPGWLVHGAKWSLFVIPVSLLGFSQSQGAVRKFDQYRNIVAAVPDSWRAHSQLGNEFVGQGNLVKAMEHFQRALRINPESAEIHNNLGSAFAKQNLLAQATFHLNRAILLKPDLADAHADLGVVFTRQGRHEQAMRHYEQTLQIEPEHAKAHNNLGKVFASRDNLVKAADHFQLALRSEPDNAVAHNNLGLVYLRQHKLSEAADHLQSAVRLKPDYAEAYNNLGVVFANQGNQRQAIEQYRRAVEHQPNLLIAVNSLAWNLSTSKDPSLRDGTAALEWAEQSARATGFQDPHMLHTLAAAYAEAARFQEATTTAQKALRLAQEKKLTALADQIESALSGYRNRRPYRD